MEKEYAPEKIEFYVQEYWKQNKTFQVNEDSKKEKYYCLPMIPYPSGKLHMGHVRNYTISDVIARYQRMLGKNVLQPMGWDAFGLPAEVAAIKNNTMPLSWTQENIKNMKKQLQSLGFSYDWSREITTCQPEYYRWEQWFFTKLYEKKLVYKKNSFVNWCSHDKTVLANEQVVDGCCWRCQNKITIKKIPQWFIKIRQYAESLYQDLKKLHHWPENVKNMQKNWIGRTKGFEISLNVLNYNQKLKIFTNRLDLIMDITFIVISSCHPLTIDLSKKNKLIKEFIRKYKYFSQEEIEKVKYEGINTNIFIIHPITEKKIPIWIANFTLKIYGANAIASIPGHNEHDYNFAIKHNLEIKCIVTRSDNKKEILFNSKKIKEILIEKKILNKKIHYRLQDWCVSRQRYWGAPIPMAKLKNGEIVSIPEDQLPVLLPEIQKNINNSEQHIYLNSAWHKILINGQTAFRETDTFDTFMESSWYYARYTCPHFIHGMIDPEASKYWLPVDQYIGGIEHAIMHLMYFRFYHKLLRDFNLVKFDEPVKNLLCQGMVLSDAFYEITNNSTRNWIHSSSVLIKRNEKGDIIKSYNKQGQEIFYAGMIKMSKSKNNGIEPESIIRQYGADTIRLFIMFAAPVESSLEWKESNVKGIYRFLNKLWILIFNYVNLKNIHKSINIICLNDQQSELLYQLHKTIHKVSDDISRRKSFNTAISAIMELVNQLIKAPIKEEQDKSILRECLTCIIKMLYPFTPHFCFYVWNYLSENTSIDNEKWPICNDQILLKKHNIIVLQINGKKRSTMKIPHNLNKEEIFLHAQNQIIIKKYLKNKNIKKTIYVPNKIINFVI
ncbi:leucine--tRNA ligase [Buchnera aphidicola]|uniref:Leucine--tRNA ligase n=1 Tax=Buchnera aphidicola str. USDA (Myzus persicae) TaxID=1009856 RepID=W0NZM7_BUCMP|nr:leucine--tRNA ligase [Buchnera aphidicola]AHG59951.1 Leus [Buchnera aphidicola str. USDA (Myzus persicae)]AHG60531.1 Leus [Buchnera aphidicola str. W106 (Myzus persicae)]AHG61104.1 Leus [Buchnera aphidicola str. G002 (Myzus persicae)]AHG61676.1 Leus [Buchnera aphidicola str. F009 (Myzus persicae)]WAI03366.1 MAG: leucine--tRNA ligase [Buchnera aphidicola (Myzus persicae)]